MGSTARKVRFVVPADDAGRRLDQVLAERIPGLSRRRARVLLDIGGVFVDGTRVKLAGRRLAGGEAVLAVVGGAFERATQRTGMAARAHDAAALPPYAIVFEDDEIVVADKPSGLLTAPTPEGDRGNLADLLARRSTRKAAIFVVHRIDLEASGLVVFAKTPAANRSLSARFRAHDLVREYLAVASGRFPGERAALETPVAGRRAKTLVSIEERLAGATLLRARLETGRTHQIRIHLADAGHPVVGDRAYGAPTDCDPPRLALHATRLALAHPATGAPLDFTSPLPPDLATWLGQLRGG